AVCASRSWPGSSSTRTATRSAAAASGSSSRGDEHGNASARERARALSGQQVEAADGRSRAILARTAAGLRFAEAHIMALDQWPNCRFSLSERADVCRKCGIVFAKWTGPKKTSRDIVITTGDVASGAYDVLRPVYFSVSNRAKMLDQVAAKFGIAMESSATPS